MLYRSAAGLPAADLNPTHPPQGSVMGSCHRELALLQSDANIGLTKGRTGTCGHASIVQRAARPTKAPAF